VQIPHRHVCDQQNFRLRQGLEIRPAVSVSVCRSIKKTSPKHLAGAGRLGKHRIHLWRVAQSEDNVPILTAPRPAEFAGRQISWTYGHAPFASRRTVIRPSGRAMDGASLIFCQRPVFFGRTDSLSVCPNYASCDRAGASALPGPWSRLGLTASRSHQESRTTTPRASWLSRRAFDFRPRKI